MSFEQETTTAPRVTPADVEASITSEHYFTAGDGCHGEQSWKGCEMNSVYPSALDQVTICVLILKNGHKIVGVNEGPVSPANFDAAIGKRMARAAAIEQIWPLLGYELRTKLAS